MMAVEFRNWLDSLFPTGWDLLTWRDVCDESLHYRLTVNNKVKTVIIEPQELLNAPAVFSEILISAKLIAAVIEMIDDSDSKRKGNPSEEFSKWMRKYYSEKAPDRDIMEDVESIFRLGNTHDQIDAMGRIKFKKGDTS